MLVLILFQKKMNRFSIILDESASMTEMHNHVHTAIHEMIETCNDNTIITISTFNETVSKGTRFSKKEALHRVQKSIPIGRTALYDAIVQCFEMEFEDPVDNRTILIFTDGIDNSSKQESFETAKRLISRANDIGWNVLFLGSSPDVVFAAERLTIPYCNALVYENSRDGILRSMRSASHSAERCRRGEQHGFTEIERSLSSDSKTTINDNIVPFLRRSSTVVR